MSHFSTSSRAASSADYANAAAPDLLDLAFDAMLVRQLDGTIIGWNDGATAMYGWRRAEALGQSVHVLLGTDAPSGMADVERELLASGTWEGRITQRHRDGTGIVVKVRWAVRTLADGRAVVCEVNRDVTEKVRAQTAEAAVTRQLSLLMLHGRVAACYITPDYRYAWVSEAYAERHDLPQAHFPGRRVVDVVGEAAFGPFRPYAERALSGETGTCVIDVAYTSHLPRQVVELAFGPDREPDGRVAGLVVAITDAAGRRAAEARARALEQRLEFLVEASDVGTWYCDLLPGAPAMRDEEGRPFGQETGTLVWSDACRRHFGLSAGMPVDAQVVASRIHPDDRARVGEAITRAIRGDGDYDETFRTLPSDDHGVRWVRGIGRVSRDVDGVPRRFDGITHEITAQKQLEQMLRERESWFRRLADSVPVALWQSDADQGCTYVSRQWCEYTGTTLRENLGEGWLAVVHPDDRDGMRAAFLGAAGSREPFAFDYRLRRADGVYRWMADMGLPRLDDEGRHEGFVGCAIDIDARKQAEQALIEDDRRKDEFLAMLAHELRNPLAPIGTAVQLLAHPEASAETSRRVVPMLQRQLRHLTRLVDDLLDVTRIRTGKLALRRGPLLLGDVIDLAVEASGPWDAGRAALRLDVPDAPTAVHGDLTRLVQVVVNILHNAAKFTPPGGEIRLHARSDGASVHLSVTDTGIGIPATFLPSIFDLFAQAEQMPGVARAGLGMGLTLARSLVDMHGGRISASSEGPGRGSTFHVELPAVGSALVQ